MYRVMIVDDMEFIRMQIKRLPLWGELTGFEIAAEAEDGQEALEKLRAQPIDLLITDIRMPRVNGIELLREVHKSDLAACVVFLSEHGEFNIAKEAIQYGIFDYLVKPVNQEELRSLLKKVKECIDEKAEVQNQVKKLEGIVAEKIEVYYPSGQVNRILQYISEENEKAVEAGAVMVEEAAAALEYDVMKTAIVLQKAYNEIWKGTMEIHQWMKQFTDITLFIDISFKQIDNIDLMKKKIVQQIEAIFSVIKKFIFKSRKSPIIREICHCVVKNIENEVCIAKISSALFLSKNYIGDVFKQETDMTLGDYITMVKVERAKKLIIEGRLKSYEIAQTLGYNNSEYFGKLFKRNTGLSPMEYKKYIEK
ncbi:MAG: two component transcriptional regulator, AraC family [Clostridia bacterium]|jgi:two-component system response regulator YesN|nr:two component transcriptional regulator, AraC family [Clostridia bacterium]